MNHQRDISSDLDKALKGIPSAYQAVVLALIDEIELRQERMIEATPAKPAQPAPLRVITNEHTQLKSDLANLQSKYETLNRESNSFKREVEKLKKELEKKDSKIEEQKQALNACYKDIKQLKLEIKDLESVIQDNNTMYDELLEKNEKLRKMIAGA